MATADLKNSSDNSTTSVMAGIIRDAQELFSQQLAMFRAEVREDFSKTKQAITPMACGVVTLFLGAILLSLMLVHLLDWAFPALTLWGAYGIVGGALTALGAGLYLAGKKRFETFNPLPDKTAQTVKENVQWLTQPK